MALIFASEVNNGSGFTGFQDALYLFNQFTFHLTPHLFQPGFGEGRLPQLADLVGERLDYLGELLTFGGTDPFEPYLPGSIPTASRRSLITLNLLAVAWLPFR